MKKAFILSVLMAVVLLGVEVTAEAQQPTKIPRIGILSNGSPGPTDAYFQLFEAFRQGLRDLGYVEGQNILLEYRYAEGRLDRMTTQAIKEKQHH